MRQRDRGFTLIEIMAVVLIIGLLGGIVGTVVFRQIDKAKVTTAKIQVKSLEQALDAYRMDNGRYPSTEQGLDALVHKPTGDPVPKRWQPEGYLSGGKVPMDPWDNAYQYTSPGSHNPYSFDVWSFGADGTPGGTGNDADVGNWSDETETTRS
jgi:general secretion pathway protein G